MISSKQIKNNFRNFYEAKSRFLELLGFVLTAVPLKLKIQFLNISLEFRVNMEGTNNVLKKTYKRN